MIILINVKSGTGGYFDEDGCDLCLMEIDDEKFPVPRVGEILNILEDNDSGRKNSEGVFLKEYHPYLVNDVRYRISDKNAYKVVIYVIPIGRSIPF